MVDPSGASSPGGLPRTPIRLIKEQQIKLVRSEAAAAERAPKTVGSEVQTAGI